MVVKKCDRCGKFYDKNSIYELMPRIGVRKTILGIGIVSDSGACKKDMIYATIARMILESGWKNRRNDAHNRTWRRGS